MQGRHILWGWLQERRKVGSYDYAGCLSVPRILTLRGDRLIQEPVPEVSNLRRGRCWKARHLAIEEEEMMPLEGLRGSSLDIELVLDRCVYQKDTSGSSHRQPCVRSPCKTCHA